MGIKYIIILFGNILPASLQPLSSLSWGSRQEPYVLVGEWCKLLEYRGLFVIICCIFNFIVAGGSMYTREVLTVVLSQWGGNLELPG